VLQQCSLFLPVLPFIPTDPATPIAPLRTSSKHVTQSAGTCQGDRLFLVDVDLVHGLVLAMAEDVVAQGMQSTMAKWTGLFILFI
jgi:hypothetical protein